MMGVCSPSTFGVEVGAGGVSSVVAPSVNPNLLTWTEHFENAVWVKTNASVSTDAGADPTGGTTADLVDLSFGLGARIAQVSAVACTTASGTANHNLTGTLTRYSVAGTVDGAPYVFSVWLADAAGPLVQLVIAAVGGFVHVSVRDQGDGAVALCWGTKLETGNTPTGDETNYGMRTT